MTETTLGDMDRERLQEMFRLIDDELVRRNEQAAIKIVGGAALISAAGRERSTRDIDYAPRSAAAGSLKEIAETIRKRERLAENWLNEEGSGGLPEKPDDDERTVFRGKALTVKTPGPRHMLAMKLLAGRPRDGGDAVHLAKGMKLTTQAELTAVFDEVYEETREKERPKVVEFAGKVIRSLAMQRYITATRGTEAGSGADQNPVRGRSARFTKSKTERGPTR